MSGVRRHRPQPAARFTRPVGRRPASGPLLSALHSRMPRRRHEYVMSDAPPAAELRRLREIDEYMGPTSERRIAQLGIARGWRCLEVGAGAGGVARWMAERVGPSGTVTAVDL